MAKTTQSLQYAAQQAAKASFNDRIDDKRQIEGAVQWAEIVVPISADNVATDVIDLIELPPGAIVLPTLSHIIVTDDATSGALTVHVGDSVDDDRYCISANCASLGVIQFVAAGATTFPAGLLTKHKTSGATTKLQAKLATFTATIEAGELRFMIAYKSL